ncbi:MAG: hypothetical protein K2Y71_22325 [Xanthobacteraceae bacterium]|nr:hypothetical protein [Xanthobacteraceae bacterium]
MLLRIRSFMIVACCFLIAPTISSAQEACHSYGTQLGEFRMCVSSVLPPQGKSTYGPDQLLGTSDGAWCEGVSGPGAGQSVTFHSKPANMVGTVTITNGYARDEKSFRNNGRVKQARIETSGGYKSEITLKDERRPQAIKLKPGRIEWIRLTIVDVYPGAGKDQDTCLSMFSPGLDG